MLLYGQVREAKNIFRVRNIASCKSIFWWRGRGKTILGWVEQWVGVKEMQMESLDKAVEKFTSEGEEREKTIPGDKKIWS